MAVVPEYDTTAGIFVPPLVGCSVKEEVVMLEGFIASLNVATTLEEAETPVAPEAGVVDTTVGGVVSEGVPATVNVHVLAVTKWLPATSVTAVDIVAVYWIPAAKFVEGLSVAVVPEYDTTAGIFVPPLVGCSVKEEVVMLEGFIASLNVATMLEEAETPVAPEAGVVDTTVGGSGIWGGTSNGKRPHLVCLQVVARKVRHGCCYGSRVFGAGCQRRGGV